MRGRLVADFLRALDQPGRAPALLRFVAHLRTETLAIMSSLFNASLDATNWCGESLHPAVVNRTVSGGSRSARGAETQQIPTSVVRTATQRHQAKRRAGRPPANSLADGRVRTPVASPR